MCIRDRLRIGGQLLKGPYLPETAAGISRTTRTLLGSLNRLQ